MFLRASEQLKRFFCDLFDEFEGKEKTHILLSVFDVRKNLSEKIRCIKGRLDDYGWDADLTRAFVLRCSEEDLDIFKQ